MFKSVVSVLDVRGPIGFTIRHPKCKCGKPTINGRSSCLACTPKCKCGKPADPTKFEKFCSKCLPICKMLGCPMTLEQSLLSEYCHDCDRSWMG